MNTTSSTVLTGVVVTTGRWAEGKTLSMRVVVGATFLAISLAVLSEANEEFARTMAILILVAALLRYAEPIAKKAGFAK